jgi:small GTP-binding protein
MSDSNQAETFKIVILGETGVGKTSIISQYIDSIFQEDLQATTGGSFSSKTYTYDNGKLLKLEIWDTAGQERYRSLTKMFYKDAGAAVLVYDITSNFSFEELKNYWAEQIKESAPQDIILAIAANKSDLSEQEKVDEDEARSLANELGAIFCSTSAKNSHGIDDLFLQIAKKHTGTDVLELKNDEDDYSIPSNLDEKERSKKGSIKITENSFKENKKRKCC